MRKFQLIGKLCGSCNEIFDANNKDHKCSTSSRVPSNVDVSVAESLSSCKSSSVSKLTTEIENQEQTGSSMVYEIHVVYETHIDAKNNENEINFNTKRIDFKNKLHPLSDHRVPESAQNKSNKQIMCSENFGKMNDTVPVNVLKRKRNCLRGKSLHENIESASSAGRENKQDNIISSINTTCSTDQSSKEILQKTVQGSKPIKRSRNDFYEYPFLREMHELKSVAPPIKLVDDKDISFCKYVSTLMKNLPMGKKLRLQDEFISKVLNSL